jgi:8-amino-7-oxononanoate synthase
MNGDVCPLQDLVTVARRYHASIILDEAHSTGSMGQSGNGMACSLNLHDQVDVRIYTFGKAMGVHGACVCGSKKLIDYLINFSRPFIYTTAQSPHSVAAIDCAFDYLHRHPGLQTELTQRIQVYNNLIADVNSSPSLTAIQTVVIRGNEKVKEAARHLQQNGFDVRPILSPTVPVGAERLRICLHTFNSEAEIGNLVRTIKSLS